MRPEPTKYVTLKRTGLVVLCLACLIVGSCLSCGCRLADLPLWR